MSAMEWVKDVGGRHTSRGLAHPYTLGTPHPLLGSSSSPTGRLPGPHCPQTLLPPVSGLRASPDSGKTLKPGVSAFAISLVSFY